MSSRHYAAVAPLAVGTLLGLIALSAFPSHAPRDYFVVVAQVDPVLLLALAVQSRLLALRNPIPGRPPVHPPHDFTDLRVVGPERENPSAARLIADDRRLYEKLVRARRHSDWVDRLATRLGAFSIAIMLVGGEILALSVLVRGGRGGDPRLVTAAIAAALAAVTLAGLLAEPPRAPAMDARREDPPDSDSAGVAA